MLICVGVMFRYQKLRKKAGLTVTDVVELYYKIPAPGHSKPNDPMFEKVLETQGEYFKDALGVSLLPIEKKFTQASVVLANEVQHVGSDEAKSSFEAIVTTQSLQVNPALLQKVCTFHDKVDCNRNIVVDVTGYAPVAFMCVFIIVPVTEEELECMDGMQL